MDYKKKYLKYKKKYKLAYQNTHIQQKNFSKKKPIYKFLNVDSEKQVNF